VVVVASGQIPFLSTRAGIMAVLDEHGHTTLTSLGFHRKVFPMGAPHHDLGQSADATVWLTTGTEVPGASNARKIATVDALDGADRRELAALDAVLSAELGRNGLHVTAKGRSLLRGSSATDQARSLARAEHDPLGALHDGSLQVLADLGLVDLPDRLGRFERYHALASMAGADGTITAWISDGRPPGPLPR
jgi:hypothetical protein